MTRDHYKVKGVVVKENGKPLPGVRITVTDNPNIEISDKEGRFEIRDVRENIMMEFSLPGYEPYYLATTGTVFTTDMTITLHPENAVNDIIYETADKMPEYPGGWEELINFIVKNVNYPEEARAQKVHGTVYVSFVVNTRGFIEDVHLLNSIHPAIDNEVLRIMGKLERFTPGFKGGKPVKVRFSIPVRFGY
jgi:protein TonB